jgi:hypothetical protein
LREYEAAKKARRDERKKKLGSEWDSDNYIDDSKPPDLSDDEGNFAPPQADEKQEEEKIDSRDDFEKKYDKLIKLYELEKAEEPENFTVLEIKARINAFFKHHPTEKKIPTELLVEAVRWRLSQNDC